MRKNYNYARLDRGNFEHAPNKLVIGDRQIFNATAEQYASLGWLPIVKTDQPEGGEGYYYTPVYTESDGVIVQSWEKHEIPETDEATETAEKAAAFDILMGVSE
ncbi:MAG: hypothetical protein IJ261_02520 [Clostridia bacterium]|nr:hypothetical protein [Clostridia bacterium]